MGTAGETCRQRYCALVNVSTAHAGPRSLLRKDKKENGRQHQDYASREVDRSVMSILKAAAPAEYRIALEVLMIFAQRTLDGRREALPWSIEVG
jgi:hypothetical protein